MSPAVSVHAEVIIKIAVELEGIGKVLRERSGTLQGGGRSLTMSLEDQATMAAAWQTVGNGLRGFSATPPGAAPAEAEAYTTAQLDSVLAGLQRINQLLESGFN